MNLKEWKEFSDLVDTENKKRCVVHSSEMERIAREYSSDSDITDCLILVEKTEENFMEWKIGKLQLIN